MLQDCFLKNIQLKTCVYFVVNSSSVLKIKSFPMAIVDKLLKKTLINLMFFISGYSANFTFSLTTTEESQNISSPNYPGRYPRFTDITFIIHSPEGSHVKLIFLDLSIDDQCRFGHLIIYNGQFHNIVNIIGK